MTTAQWNEISEAYNKGDERPFQKAYEEFHSKLKPKFRSRYDGLAADFDSLFNDKFLEIFQRTLNHTLVIQQPEIDGLIFRAVDNKYREILRKKKSARQRNAPITVALDHPDMVKSPPMTLANFEIDSAKSESDLQSQLLPEILKQMDDFGKKILEGLLAGKKDKQIKIELNYQSSNAAFSDKKKRTFKKFRKLYALEKLKVIKSY